MSLCVLQMGQGRNRNLISIYFTPSNDLLPVIYAHMSFSEKIHIATILGKQGCNSHQVKVIIGGQIAVLHNRVIMALFCSASV